VLEQVEAAPDEITTLNAIGADRDHDWDRATVDCLRARDARVPVVLSTRLSLRGVVGPKQTHIYLHSNDPQNPVFQCKMAGSAVIDPSVIPPSPATPAPPPVERDLTAFPPEITVDPAEKAPLGNVHYVIVRGKNDQPFNVTNVVVMPPAFPARLHSMKSVWSRLKVGPITADSLGSGAVVRVYTDMPGAAPLEIPVKPARSP
jgi:hypothetical protein